jgi:hypothetical protein
VVAALAAAALCAVQAASAQSGAGDVVYVPTPQSVVDRMLAVARVESHDLVIDLGSGDGRIVITAAKQYGARGLGLDLDRVLVGNATRNAAEAGVGGKAKFLRRNIFQFDLSDATVVTTYLGPGLMLKLRPKLLRELKPGVRIVSHDYHFGDWAPDEALTLKVPEKKVGTPGLSYVYLWTVPASVHGIWRIEVEGAGGAEPYELALVQQYQSIEGVLRLDAKPLQLADPQLAGAGIRFGVPAEAGATYDFNGRVSGAEMAGELTISRGESRETRRWKAMRVSPALQLE